VPPSPTVVNNSQDNRDDPTVCVASESEEEDEGDDCNPDNPSISNAEGANQTVCLTSESEDEDEGAFKDPTHCSNYDLDARTEQSLGKSTVVTIILQIDFNLELYCEWQCFIDKLICILFRRGCRRTR